MIELNELLRKVGVDPASSIVMRHRPTERDLRRALRWFAAEHPDVYNAYQCCHGERVEGALGRASHLVSLLGHEAGKALFVGVYRVDGWKEMLGKDWRKLATSKRLIELGDRGPRNDRRIHLFNLVCTEHLEAWKGKLVIEWPPPERAWWRWAGRNKMPVDAIHEESVLVRQMPPWNELVLSWPQLQALPRSWQEAIKQWRGIYLILDRTGGKSYVGSAYGDENILARWRSYGKTGHGGNVDLKGRDPAHFQFAVLERVSPDLPSDDVIRLEATWKDRLGTREFGLNKN